MKDQDNPEEDQLIILKTFEWPAEVHPLMSKLESEGIECVLVDENIVGVLPPISNAVGGVKLKIKATDLKRAFIVLKQLHDESIHRMENRVVDEKWKKDYVAVDAFCPSCESYQVYRKKYSAMLVTIVSMFMILMMFLGVKPQRLYCADCGHIWE